MGSQSDLKVMKAAAEILEELGTAYELTIVSAHRTPLRMVEYATEARRRGLQVIIAGAGGAAHLPGMVASLTHIAGYRCARKILQLHRWMGLCALHPPNAIRGAGSDRCAGWRPE